MYPPKVSDQPSSTNLINDLAPYGKTYQEAEAAVMAKLQEVKWNPGDERTGDIELLDDSRGWAWYFTDGTVYWTKETGAHAVQGAIAAYYYSLGAQKSYLGYPTSDELSGTISGVPLCRYSTFEHGMIAWDLSHGTLVPTATGGTRQIGEAVEVSISGNGFTANTLTHTHLGYTVSEFARSQEIIVDQQTDANGALSTHWHTLQAGLNQGRITYDSNKTIAVFEIASRLLTRPPIPPL